MKSFVIPANPNIYRAKEAFDTFLFVSSYKFLSQVFIQKSNRLMLNS